MAFQDLTPQLRTRLNRVERAVGIFVLLATLLVFSGLGYYVYHTGQNKGWFLTKLPFNTFVGNAEGLHVGDPVKLFGFEAGTITEITTMPPFYYAGAVYVGIEIKHPYYDYIWDDSLTKVTSDLLNKRSLEIVPGGTSGRTNLHESYQFSDKARNVASGVWNDQTRVYDKYTNGHKGYTLYASQSKPLAERLEMVALKVEEALPQILALTNQLASVLTNAARVVANVDATVSEIRPVVSNANVALLTLHPTLSNISTITTYLKNPNGSLGDWLIPTNLNTQVGQTLSNANIVLLAVTNTLARGDTLLYNADTNLSFLVNGLAKSLDNLGNLTSNLNTQVAENPDLVKRVSDAIVHTDDLVQGLKRHWLLRSAFKDKKTNAPPGKASGPVNINNPGGKR